MTTRAELLQRTLVATLGETARDRTQLVVTMSDGARHAGRVVVTGITYAVLDCSDGRQRRVDLADVERIITRDGLRLWPCGREVRTWGQ